MKKIFSLMIFFAFAISMPFAAVASEPLTFTADTSALTDVSSWQSILVPIRVTNNPGIAGVDLTVTLSDGLEWDYDPAAYNRNADFSETWPFIPGNSVALTARPSVLGATTNFGFINVDSTPAAFNSVGDGVLITLKLKVSGGIPPGSNLTVGINVTACGNAAAASIPRTSVDGIITVDFGVPNTGFADITRNTWLAIVFAAISLALWSYVLRQRFVRGSGL